MTDKQVMIDRCPKCGAAIFWNEEQFRRVFTCACVEKNPNCCSDGACEGICFNHLDN
jgi:hypothetical protein